jgi:hypothetical protein
MDDVLDQRVKNKILRVIDFCEGEGIELFTFTELVPSDDCSVEFDLDFNFGEYWQLIVTIGYLDFMKDDEDMREDKKFFYKIENENFTQVEDFEEEYDEDEDFEEEEF